MSSQFAHSLQHGKRGQLTYQCQLRSVTKICVIAWVYFHRFSFCVPGQQGQRFSNAKNREMDTVINFQRELSPKLPTYSLKLPHCRASSISRVVLKHLKIPLKYPRI